MGDVAKLAQIVTDPGVKQTYTSVQESDARTALARGLAEYLRGLSIEVGGRQVIMNKVFPTWADPETNAEYPSAVIYSDAPGSYEPSRLSPQPSPDGRIANTHEYVYSTCEYVIDFKLDVRCTDSPERRYMVMALEQTLSPVLYMYGFKLDLPFYFGQRGVYEPKSMKYLDDELSAMQKFRVAQFLITAQVPVTRIVTLPFAKIRTVLEVTEA
jgi:hypothetical protein